MFSRVRSAVPCTLRVQHGWLAESRLVNSRSYRVQSLGRLACRWRTTPVLRRGFELGVDADRDDPCHRCRAPLDVDREMSSAATPARVTTSASARPCPEPRLSFSSLAAGAHGLGRVVANPLAQPAIEPLPRNRSGFGRHRQLPSDLNRLELVRCHQTELTRSRVHSWDVSVRGGCTGAADLSSTHESRSIGFVHERVIKCGFIFGIDSDRQNEERPYGDGT
jgi:hypothetical protein